MSNPIPQLLRVVTVAAFTGVACAQVAEIGAFGGMHRLRGNVLGKLPADTVLVNTSLDDGWLLGFRLTLNSGRFFGHEFGYAYNRTSMQFTSVDGSAEFDSAGTAAHEGFYNYLVYAMPEGSSVRVFGAGGGHFHNYAWPGLSAVSGGGATKFGFNFGGGIKVRVTPIWGIRFDVRDFWNKKPFGLIDQSGWIRHLQFTAGFSLLL